MKIYVASSWRNKIQPDVIRILKKTGHDVYDFRHPDENDNGFHWSEIDPKWESWTAAQFKNGLEHPLAKNGFRKDMDALNNADATILVMPCGRSAHLELGVATGLDQHTAIFLPPGQKVEPELMWKMVQDILLTESDVIDWAYSLK